MRDEWSGRADSWDEFQNLSLIEPEEERELWGVRITCENPWKAIRTGHNRNQPWAWKGKGMYEDVVNRNSGLNSSLFCDRIMHLFPCNRRMHLPIPWILTWPCDLLQPMGYQWATMWTEVWNMTGGWVALFISANAIRRTQSRELLPTPPARAPAEQSCPCLPQTCGEK